jgi:hypothetical protein
MFQRRNAAGKHRADSQTRAPRGGQLYIENETPASPRLRFRANEAGEAVAAGQLMVSAR